MKITEELKKYRNFSQVELNKELPIAEKKMVSEKLKVLAGKEQNFSSVEKSRKSVARLKTLIAEQQRSQNVSKK